MLHDISGSGNIILYKPDNWVESTWSGPWCKFLVGDLFRFRLIEINFPLARDVGDPWLISDMHNGTTDLKSNNFDWKVYAKRFHDRHADPISQK